MGLEKILKTRQGRIIISIIWGLGLACLFRKVCVGRNCIIYKAPDPKHITQNIYSHNSKCYKYAIETTKCHGEIINK